VAVAVKGASAEAMVATLRARVERVAGEVPVMSPSTYASQLSLQFIHLRLASRMLGWGGALGLFLALIGVYGLVSFTVTQHTRDIAIRRAVGADAAAVVRSVVRRSLMLAGAGLGLGLLVVIPAAHLVRGVLVGVGPADPVSLVGGVVLLALTSALASVVPARRAARIDPMVALRQE
jgi:ABC-type lipoprotein release transport system permease subunit